MFAAAVADAVADAVAAATLQALPAARDRVHARFIALNTDAARNYHRTGRGWDKVKIGIANEAGNAHDPYEFENSAANIERIRSLIKKHAQYLACVFVDRGRSTGTAVGDDDLDYRAEGQYAIGSIRGATAVPRALTVSSCYALATYLAAIHVVDKGTWAKFTYSPDAHSPPISSRSRLILPNPIWAHRTAAFASNTMQAAVTYINRDLRMETVVWTEPSTSAIAGLLSCDSLRWDADLHTLTRVGRQLLNRHMAELFVLMYYNKRRHVHVMRLLHSNDPSDHRMTVMEASFMDPEYTTAHAAFRKTGELAFRVMSEVLYATRRPVIERANLGDGRYAFGANAAPAMHANRTFAEAEHPSDVFSPIQRARHTGTYLGNYARRGEGDAEGDYRGPDRKPARYATAINSYASRLTAVWRAAGVNDRRQRIAVLGFEMECQQFPRAELDVLAHAASLMTRAEKKAAGRQLVPVLGATYSGPLKYIHFDQEVNFDASNALLDMTTMFAGSTSVDAEYRRYCDSNAAPLDDTISQVTKSARLLALTHTMTNMGSPDNKELFVRSMQHAARQQNPHQEETELMQLMQRMQVEAGAISQWPVAGFHRVPPPAPRDPVLYTSIASIDMLAFDRSIKVVKGFTHCLTPAK